MKKDQETSFQRNEERNGSIKGTVSCMICQAVYAPSQLRTDLIQASPLALESTFMSMCHFCFRCRRPSCPECWDYVHGLCAACDQDANLPFRTELPPLYGTLLPPMRQAQLISEPAIAASLLCIRPGVYEQNQILPIDKVTTRPETFVPLRMEMVSPVPALTTRNTTRSANALPQVAEQKTQPPTRKPAPTAFKKPGRIAAWLFFLVLLCALILVVAALISAEINTYIFITFHMNIRSGIAFLLQFFHRFFS
ncbi:MAG TPA: hypothetical protein VGN34_28940 [Ktedonobacteraceae bacterium]